MVLHHKSGEPALTAGLDLMIPEVPSNSNDSVIFVVKLENIEISRSSWPWNYKLNLSQRCVMLKFTHRGISSLFEGLYSVIWRGQRYAIWNCKI